MELRRMRETFDPIREYYWNVATGSKQVKYSDLEYPYSRLNYAQKLIIYLYFHYPYHRGTKLLDIGCGNGDFISAWKDVGIHAFGVDLEQPQYTAHPDWWNEGTCSVWDLEKDILPFKENTFDFVFSKSTLEHVYNWRHLLRETRRVLKPKGTALFLVPDYDSQKWKFFDDPTHVKPYTRKSLAMAFQLAGFSQVECSYFNLHKFKVNNSIKAWLLYRREKMLLCYAIK